MSSLPVFHHTEVIAHNYPIKVAVTHEVVMSEDLNQTISRRTMRTLVYDNDEVVLNLSADQADQLRGWLMSACAAHRSGLQGDAASEERFRTPGYDGVEGTEWPRRAGTYDPDLQEARIHQVLGEDELHD